MIFMPFLLLITFIAVLLQPTTPDVEYQLMSADSNSRQVSTDSPKTTTNKKRMAQQQFYPQLDKIDQTINTTVIVEESGPNPQLTSIEPVEPTFSKTTLLNELTSEMKLTQMATNVLLDDVSNINQAIPTTFVDSYKMAETPSALPEEQVATTDNTTSESLPVTDIELSSFVTTDSIKPLFKKYAAPSYPQHFWFNQIEQEVIATFKINPNGRAYDISLSSQKNKFVAFEQEVEKAMKKWRFDTASLNSSTLQRTYQQIFSFAITDDVQKNCDLKTTGSRLSKAMPCNK